MLTIVCKMTMMTMIVGGGGEWLIMKQLRHQQEILLKKCAQLYPNGSDTFGRKANTCHSTTGAPPRNVFSFHECSFFFFFFFFSLSKLSALQKTFFLFCFVLAFENTKILETYAYVHASLLKWKKQKQTNKQTNTPQKERSPMCLSWWSQTKRKKIWHR
ncbi:hypothetical protein RFI_19926 [Reticulomyxa filosa]|uniref:Uncharacterized protein n=1 Tax=Reticulomyxa filosa TaxID=46433 RepID=X6MUU3_RETFI|nr:hypothetical protein RFI_19926 [Reticulomyxa filosa]|eukprot:ETO17396.1 hypothetical protein RFI_19926 [Reticulomyxa filosa]